MKASIKKIARLAGALYLVNIALGFFALGYVPGIVMADEPQLTAQHIIANEQLYRLSLVAHLIILLSNFPLALIWYKLFKPVNRNATLLVVFFTLVATAVEICNLLNQFMPLIINHAAFAKDFSQGQLNSLAFMFHRLTNSGVNLAFFFFGFYGISAGYLIIKSGFLPKMIGGVMAIGGSCYIINSITNFLFPAFAPTLFPFILIPSGLAELSFCLWLLIAGVNVKKWEAQYASSRINVGS